MRRTKQPPDFGSSRRGVDEVSSATAGHRRRAASRYCSCTDDTDLPDDALQLIERRFEDPAVGAACFKLRFDNRHWLLGIYAFFTRFDSLFTTFGDQGIVIRRAFFKELGGFPDWPLFEDVELGRRTRRRSRIVKLLAAVTTSAERFERNGVVRQQLGNAWLILRFLLGATPESLTASYERHRSRSWGSG